MSSQTTDTPGTTQTNVQDRSGATFQTYPIPQPNANPSLRILISRRSSPTRPRHATKRAIFRLLSWGLAAIFPLQRRRLRKQYTPPKAAANWGEAVAESASFRGRRRRKGTQTPSRRRNCPLWAAAHRVSASSTTKDRLNHQGIQQAQSRV